MLRLFVIGLGGAIGTVLTSRENIRVKIRY